MLFNWNEEKNQQLIAERGVSFEMVVVQVAQDRLIATYRHPNHEKYPNQFIFVVELNAYLYCVPFVKQDETIFPSRKATKAYRSDNNE